MWKLFIWLLIIGFICFLAKGTPKGRDPREYNLSKGDKKWWI